MGILDEPTAVTWSDLDATYALKPDNGARAVGQGELVLNVRDYGAAGDGVADDAGAINAALADAAAANCPSVVLLPWTATGYGASGLTVGSGVTLRGDNSVRLRKIGPSSPTFMTVSGNDALIEGLTLDGNGLATTRVLQIASSTSRVTVRDCHVTDSGGLANVSGVETRDGVVDVVVERCRFDGVDTPVFINKGPARCTVRYNRITNWTTRGIYVLGDATAATTDLVIERNHISANVNTGGTRQPIQIVGVDTKLHQRVRVNFNTVIGAGKAYTAADPGTADGISLHRCVDFEVIGNISCDGGDMGITVSQQCARGVVANNTCTNNDVGAIALGSATTTSVTSISVTGNVAMNNGQNRNGDRHPHDRTGLYIYNARDLTITGNTIGDDQPGKTQQYAVSMWSSTGLRFAANTFSGLTVGSFFNGGNVTGSHFGAAPAPAIKAADTKVRHSASRTADPHLATAVEAGGVYLFEAFLVYRSSATADVSISWAVPLGARMNWVADGPQLSTDSANAIVARSALGSASSKPLGGTATDAVAMPRGILHVGARAGALRLLWGQAKAEWSDTILRAGSYLLVTRVG